jgi:hypothetical protein
VAGQYADTGVMTFLVSHDGVYEKDLGPAPQRRHVR